MRILETAIINTQPIMSEGISNPHVQAIENVPTRYTNNNPYVATSRKPFLERIRRLM
jgi:hypothetical protein